MSLLPSLLNFDIGYHTVCSILLLYAVFNLIRWRQKTYNYFKEIGIPGPEPSLLWGNLTEYHEKDIVYALDEWCEKYGDVFGFYNGDVPMLVVKDLDFLRFTFIKNFQNFTDRGITMRTDQEHSFLGQGLIHARGAQWKRIRSCISQVFTSKKLKKMMPHIEETADILMKLLDEKADAGGEWLMRSSFEGLSMDYMTRAGFGFDCCFQKDLMHPFIKTARAVLRGVMKGWVHFVTQSTTTMGTLMAPLMWLNEQLGSFSYSNFNMETTKVLTHRLNNPKLRRADILQVLLDAREDDSLPKNGESDRETMSKLTAQEVGINTTVLIFAGFETTSIALNYVAFILAKHQDIQDKVRSEVTSVLEEYGQLDFESVMRGLKYLGNVIDETLRLYPPVTVFTTRRALNDFEYNGVTYKAGTCIMAPTLQIHMDPRYWPEPEKFDPDRFLPENVATRPTMAYQPFGDGPRNCVGRRLSLLELRYTMARVVEKFKMTLGESQKGRMDMKFFAMVSSPANGPYIKFERL